MQKIQLYWERSGDNLIQNREWITFWILKRENLLTVLYFYFYKGKILSMLVKVESKVSLILSEKNIDDVVTILATGATLILLLYLLQVLLYDTLLLVLL